MIEKIFGSKVGTKILLCMGRSPYKEFYLNELSKRLSIGLGRTKTILDTLTNEKLLIKNKSGNRVLFRLNPNNDLSFEIIKLSNMDAVSKLPERFRVALNNLLGKYKEMLGDKLTSLVVFGSVAKGTATKWSDMDVLVIVKEKLGKKERRRIMDASYEISGTFSETLQEVIYTEKEFVENYRDGDDFLVNIMKDGIVLFDKSFFSAYLMEGLPKVTKKTIGKRLQFSKERLDECVENFKKQPQITASMLLSVSISLTRAVLLLHNIIPGSKHEISQQLESIGERKLSMIYKKTRKWFDEVHPNASKEEVWEIISFLKEKYKDSCKMLEDWK